MTHTHVTDKEEIKKIIRETWEGDDNFFLKYAVNAGFEESVNDTTEKVLVSIETYNASFYALMDGNNLLGYIDVVPNLDLLYSFGLKKKFRDRENKKQFMLIIESFFNNKQIVLSLYKKNSRAINFFIQNGYTELKEESITLVKTIV